LIRVKRDKNWDPLERLELEFNKNGTLKRRKLIGQSEALCEDLASKVNIGNTV